MIVIIMGVSGSGKSTVGQLLAAELGWTFLDADSLHPDANVSKMTNGVPLTDTDRAPWLAAVHERILESVKRQESLAVACSALKQRYRNTLASGVAVTWIYLKGSEKMIYQRMQVRQHHFMSAQMLASQFAELEEPTDAMAVDIALAPDVAAHQLAIRLRKLMASNAKQFGSKSI